jgi:3,4-dihydroxy 2-butanone 4-phosphate synthase/GTP cyclohydrolase II
VGKPVEVATVPIPTPYGEFLAHAFQVSSGLVYLALVRGDLNGGEPVLARLHSECLTGDALGSLRCDCGVQLRLSLRVIAAEGRGVLVYATGQEGRGIGLVNKLRAYVEQDGGADTVDANLLLGLPVENRHYDDAADVLRALGVGSVRLLTNNPTKVAGLEEAGIKVDSVERLRTAPHARNLSYLRTKGRRMGHLKPSGEEVPAVLATPVDVMALLGHVSPRADRPYVVVKYAQTLDGRIATRDGDSKWISGEAERSISHALRAACDAVLVGVGTVIQDDPQLTVRMVPGASPLRVVLDSTLRTPWSARVLEPDAATMIITTDASEDADRSRLRDAGVAVRVVPSSASGVDVSAALAVLRRSGVRSLLVEGGAGVITSLLGAGLVDRLIVGTAPKIIGNGTDAVGDLGVVRVSDGISLTNRSVHVTPEDVITAWDVDSEAFQAAADSGGMLLAAGEEC